MESGEAMVERGEDGHVGCPFDAVIFDMDGLMFDSERIWASLWEPAFAAFGLHERPGLRDAARGTSEDTTRAVIAGFYDEDDARRAGFADVAQLAAAAHAELHRLATIRFSQGVPTKPGLVRLLAYLAGQNVPMAIASSSDIEKVRINLNHAGIDEGLFSCVITGVEMARSKPAPDIFLAAARRLGSAPERTLVLEDSFNGVRAGHAGGFFTVMVPDVAQPTDEILAQCDACLPSLNAVCDALEAEELAPRG